MKNFVFFSVPEIASIVQKRRKIDTLLRKTLKQRKIIYFSNFGITDKWNSVHKDKKDVITVDATVKT